MVRYKAASVLTRGSRFERSYACAVTALPCCCYFFSRRDTRGSRFERFYACAVTALLLLLFATLLFPVVSSDFRKQTRPTSRPNSSVRLFSSDFFFQPAVVFAWLFLLDLLALLRHSFLISVCFVRQLRPNRVRLHDRLAYACSPRSSFPFASLALGTHLRLFGLKSHPLACVLFASLHISFLPLPSFCSHFRDDFVAESYSVLL